ncbi:extracellular solute-binding protein [Tropicimonas isoalkanivorans]|uniref:Multiple sugar transport system substrate-binding protein n=1 Tax=Tropicimonas isoalkanivorans TaxID=441112 RepID=A0A1I1MRE1_9RHOB|nr:extracellular solute-binding protein [Tropicimonas isoalkanivorans]SFC87951.1 multiple sugar transport system substrate-binding protein [Tropicimonas isoalkanivorans]
MVRIVTIVILLAAIARAEAAPLEVLTRDGTPIAGPAIWHAESFAAETGIKVEVTQRPFHSLYGEIMIGFVTGRTTADVLIIPSAWLPDFAPYLLPVPPALVDSPLVQGVHPAYRDALMRWKGRWMAMTLDGDLHMGAYRKDLFEDPQTRAAFARIFGKPLAPPQSWAEYSEIATFFHDRPGPDGRPLAGTLEASAEGGQRLWYLFSHAAAYTAHPDHPGHVFFDPQTMSPEIDNPAWRRALDDYLAALEAGLPSDGVPLASHEVRARFAAGDAAMAIDWSDIGVVASDPEGSEIAGKVGFFVLPGSRDVWNPEAKAWEALPDVRTVPFLAFGGWIAVVPRSADDPRAAWDYIAWMADPARTDRDVTDGTSGFNPYRRSQLEASDRWASVMGPEAASAYLSVLRESLSLPQTAPDLRLPGYPAYMAALDAQLGRVLAGEAPPDEALSAAAVAWDQITDRLGRASQLRNYREAMGLESDPR